MEGRSKGEVYVDLFDQITKRFVRCCCDILRDLSHIENACIILHISLGSIAFCTFVFTAANTFFSGSVLRFVCTCAVLFGGGVAARGLRAGKYELGQHGSGRLYDRFRALRDDGRVPPGKTSRPHSTTR